MSPKKFEGQKTRIFLDFRTQNPDFEHRHSLMRNVGKSKTIVSICGYVSTSIPIPEGVPHPPLTSAVPLVCGVGQVNFESI